MEIVILNRQRAFPVNATRLRDFVDRLGVMLSRPRPDSVALCLVSDARMRRFNREFRGKDAATDVLSFPDASPGPLTGERHLGDIVISVETAAIQARRARHSLAQELERLALHGYLHLLGFDHETDDGTMRRLERRLARSLRPASRECAT